MNGIARIEGGYLYESGEQFRCGLNIIPVSMYQMEILQLNV